MRIEFRPADAEAADAMREYFSDTRLNLDNYSSAGVYMWGFYFDMYYAVVGRCLVLLMKHGDMAVFDYPVSRTGDPAEETEALELLEEHCRETGTRLAIGSVPRSRLGLLLDRYAGNTQIFNPRRWRDYVYSADDFRTYPGSRFAGQRNHVNRFRRENPGCAFTELTPADGPRIKRLLDVFAVRQRAKGDRLAEGEIESVYGLAENLGRFGLCLGGVERGDGELIGFSAGEVCGDMLIIHAEKALTEYEGVYPYLAQEFVRRFASEGVRYVNREDDSGDRGLRKSKLQYNPLFLAAKYNVVPGRLIDGVTASPTLKGERVTLRAAGKSDADAVYRLEYDAERNRYWGFDWRQFFDGEPAPEMFLEGWKRDFAEKREMPLGIYVGGKLAGEAVLHNFGYRDDCEVGVRLLPEYEGHGYASEAVRLLCDYALFTLDADVVHAKCFRENERSRRMLLRAGMRPCGGDDVYHRFRLDAAT